MSTTKHTRSIHIDAPVETVFHYVEEPAHLIAGMPDSINAKIGAVNLTPEGVGTTYECKYRELGMHLTSVFTREQYEVNQRIIDHSSLGPVFTMTFEPEDAGTRLTYAWDASRVMKMLDAVFFHGDKEIEEELAFLKRGVEALS